MPEIIYQRQLQISVEKATWPRLKFLKSTRVKRTLTQLKAIPRMSMWSLQSKIQVPTKKLGGYPYEMIQTTLSEVSFAGRQSALQQKAKARKQILLFVTTYHSSVSNFKNILIQNWDSKYKISLCLTLSLRIRRLSYRTEEINLLQTCSLKLSYEGVLHDHLQLNHAGRSAKTCHLSLFIHSYITQGVRAGLSLIFIRSGTYVYR